MNKNWTSTVSNGNPCHGCKDRHIGCHGANGQCPNGYQEWAAKRRAEREEEYRRRESQETISYAAKKKMWIRARYCNQQPVRRSGKER